MSGVALQVDGLRAGYDGVPVVRDLSFEVASGEVVALFGPNGAGKTTTLLTMSGLLPTLAGEIRMDGRSLVGIPAHQIARLGVAHVPEDRAIFHQLTVAENLRLGRAATPAALSRILEYFPALANRLKQKAGSLSGGEQQMLALARAVVAEPRVLLIDEMSLGLAPIIARALGPVVRRIADEQGAAVLVVEQHVALALGFVDRGYILNHGVLVLEATAAELRSDPELLKASYLGAEFTDAISESHEESGQ